MRWQRKAFDSFGLTQLPAGPYLDQLARHSIGTIRVTTPGFDNIGEVLTIMGVAYEPYFGQYDCDLLFMNCGTSDRLDVDGVRHFVEDGGCLYASDLTSDFVTQAFPGVFQFGGGHGSRGTVAANVVDAELRSVIGSMVSVHFDMGAWSILHRCRGDVLVEAAAGTQYAGLPIMVGAEFGRGAVFYTSFHNRAQASEQEQALLQLLVLKQIGTRSNLTLKQTGYAVGVNLTALRRGETVDGGAI